MPIFSKKEEKIVILDKIRNLLPMTLKEIGQVLKYRREFLNLRQEDLAEMSGITVRTIYDVENGSSNPSYATLEKLSDTLGMELTIQVKKIN